MPSRSDLESWRKSLAEIDSDIAKLKRAQRKTLPREAAWGLPTVFCKRDYYSDWICELKCKRADAQAKIEELEQELSNEM